MGFLVLLQDKHSAPVKGMTDPFGLLFDASGDFDELIDSGLAPTLAAIDPQATTTLRTTEVGAIVDEVDQLLARVPESARQRHGQGGQAWRGLTRFRVMLDLCREFDGSKLVLIGD
ncbi:MAG: hypothetical protein ACRCYU_01910 [Nocardioides sp.]